MLKTIRLTPEDVKHFVDVASKCDFDIDICYNRVIVDAKSIMAIFSLNLLELVNVCLYCDDNEIITKFIEQMKEFET